MNKKTRRLSRRQQRWLGRALYLVDRIFGVMTIAMIDPDDYRAAAEAIQARKPQHIFPWNPEWKDLR